MQVILTFWLLAAGAAPCLAIETVTIPVSEPVGGSGVAGAGVGVSNTGLSGLGVNDVSAPRLGSPVLPSVPGLSPLNSSPDSSVLPSARTSLPSAAPAAAQGTLRPIAGVHAAGIMKNAPPAPEQKPGSVTGGWSGSATEIRRSLETGGGQDTAAVEHASGVGSAVFDLRRRAAVQGTDPPGAPVDGTLGRSSRQNPSLGHPSGRAAATAGSLLGSIFSEKPGLKDALAARVRASAYGRAAPGDAWVDEFAAALTPLLELRARSLGHADLAAFIAWAAGDSEHARMERAGLAQLLETNTGHRAEDWTYIFRDHPLWQEPLAAYLDKTIAERKASGRRELSLQSVGTGYGSESYSLAIMVDAALRRAGEDPGAWTVRIETFDISMLSLLTAGKGIYRLGPRDKDTFSGLGLAGHFEELGEGLYRLKAPLRDWIVPVYADLNDPRQHPLATGRAVDVVFANYLLYHLRWSPAVALAEHWLAGEWSPHGFLSMAQTVVAEVGASERTPAPVGKDMSFLERYAGNTGWAGRAFYGDDFSMPGSWFRDWKRKLWNKTAQSVLSLGRRLESALHRDPFFTAGVDDASARWLAAFAREHGVDVVLTTEERLLNFDPGAGKLYANAGWLLAGDDAPARRELLQRLAAEELAGSRETSRARGPPEPARLRHPRFGEGILLLSGVTPEGAVLKLGDFQGKPALYWLTPRLIPISEAYRSDNAAKPAEKVVEEERARHNPYEPRGVKGFY